MAAYLRLLDIMNFGPVKRGTVTLSRLHALIGPNDAGKSTALRAIRMLGLAARHESFESSDIGLIRDPWELAAVSSEVRTSRYLVRRENGAFVEGYATREGARLGPLSKGAPGLINLTDLAETLGNIQLLRLDPDAMREPTALLTNQQPIQFMNERGQGLGSVLDAIFARKAKDYLALESELRAAFPAIDSFKLDTNRNGRRVGVRLTDGSEIMPEAMSEGLLYFLAFAALRYLTPRPGIILVEEPENGLHPSRIAEVVRLMRDLSSTTQVVIATHSPLVVNELQPDEVTVVTRSAQLGTQFTPLEQTPNFEQRKKVYALGELWLSYANGTDEAPLLKGTETK